MYVCMYVFEIIMGIILLFDVRRTIMINKTFSIRLASNSLVVLQAIHAP